MMKLSDKETWWDLLQKGPFPTSKWNLTWIYHRTIISYIFNNSTLFNYVESSQVDVHCTFHIVLMHVNAMYFFPSILVKRLAQTKVPKAWIKSRMTTRIGVFWKSYSYNQTWILSCFEMQNILRIPSQHCGIKQWPVCQISDQVAAFRTTMVESAVASILTCWPRWF